MSNLTPHRLSAGRTTFALALLAGLVSCATVPTETAQDAIVRANTAMGGTQLRNITFSGTGTGTTFGQAYAPGTTWPRISYSSVSRVADYENGAFREDAARSRAETTGGGALPLMDQGEQRTTGMLRSIFAWNMVGPAPVPSPAAANGRIHDLWTTPHGVLQAAMANNPRIATRNDGGRTLSAISFAMPGRFTATALIGPGGLVERIESVQPNAVMGDIASVINFSDYREVAGIRFPMRIQQSLGGQPVLDLAVSDVKANSAALIEVPALVPAFAERIAVEKAADGVWFFGGGSHNSVAIEMKDHMIVVEAPLYDGCSSLVMEEARKLGNGKPVRYVVNSHHHFDHAGGLRAAVAGGATLVTSNAARSFFEQAFANPNSISPDALQKSGKRASFLPVNGKHSFTDGERVVEVHFIEGNVHAQGFMMTYLPKEAILIEADAYTPAPPNAPAPARPNDLTVNLVQNMERLQLRPTRILPLHGRMVPVSELMTAAGRGS